MQATGEHHEHGGADLRVLFVDDEPRVLAALQRMLQGRRPGWALRFAGGGAQALDLLADQPVDVVVSDLRMPGMDGAELLAAVREGPGDTRERARALMLDVFRLLGDADPLVGRYRRNLTTALF